jgi:hypothetical protein
MAEKSIDAEDVAETAFHVGEVAFALAEAATAITEVSSEKGYFLLI